MDKYEEQAELDRWRATVTKTQIESVLSGYGIGGDARAAMECLVAIEQLCKDIRDLDFDTEHIEKVITQAHKIIWDEAVAKWGKEAMMAPSPDPATVVTADPFTSW